MFRLRVCVRSCALVVTTIGCVFCCDAQFYNMVVFYVCDLWQKDGVHLSTTHTTLVLVSLQLRGHAPAVHCGKSV